MKYRIVRKGSDVTVATMPNKRAATACARELTEGSRAAHVYLRTCMRNYDSAPAEYVVAEYVVAT